jgi:hypothetical protein
LTLLQDPLYFIFMIFLYTIQLAFVVVAFRGLVEGGGVLLVYASEALSQSVMMATMIMMMMTVLMLEQR